MHTFTHYYISNSLFSEYKFNKEINKDLFLLGSVLPDFYIFKLSRFKLILNLLDLNLFQNEKKENGLKDKNIHSYNQILNILLLNNNIEESSILMGMLAHMIVDEVAHRDLIVNEINKFSIDKGKNHFLLERNLDLSINDNYKEYHKIEGIFTLKNLKYFKNTEIFDSNIFIFYLNIFTWKIYFKYKIYIEDRKFNSNLIDNKRYIHKSISLLIDRLNQFNFIHKKRI